MNTPICRHSFAITLASCQTFDYLRLRQRYAKTLFFAAAAFSITPLLPRFMLCYAFAVTR